MKRVFSFVMSLVVSLSMFVSFSTTASAGLLIGTQTGQMQDTSADDNGTIYWELSYNMLRRTASLKLSGDGYMPNGTDQCWRLAKGNCYITELIIEDGVKSIMEGAFSGEEKLKSVVLPDSIEFMGDGAFADTGITSVTLPKNLKTFNGSVFNSQKLTQYNVHPENFWFTAIDGVVYSSDLTKLVAYPVGRFSNGGANDFVIPESVTHIGDFAFMNCNHKEFKIPGTVKNIGTQAFAGNVALSSVDIENGVESIYDGAFLACNELTSIHLPTSVKYIGYLSFSYIYDFDFDGLGFMLDQLGVEHDTITADNAAYYVTYTPYTLDDFVYCKVDDKAKIYAPTNSAGHKYCKIFGVTYRASEAITPKLISAGQTVSGVEIKWSVSSDANGYYVYRKNKSGDFKKIATVKGRENTTYTDKSAYSSYNNVYTVKAYNSAGVSRYKVAGISAYYIATPVLSSANNHYNGIKVSWKKVSGATNYNIYRKTDDSDYWEHIGVTDKSKVYYIDKNVSALNNYKYTVCAYDNVGISEYDSDGVGEKYVSAPKVSTFKNTTKGVQLGWENISGASSYRIYRKAENGSWKLLKKFNNKTFTYTDTNVKSGVKYSYAVKAVSSGTLSGYYKKTTEYLKKPIVSSAKSTKSGITIKYSKSIGAEKYRIYRKVSGDDEWTRIATVKGASILSYKDETAKKGVTYYYTVRAFSGSYKSAYDTKGYKIKDKY